MQASLWHFSAGVKKDKKPLTKKSLKSLFVRYTSQHANLAGTSWASGNLELDCNGTCSYTEVGYASSGVWSATADMLRTITTVENGSGMYVENLYEYEIAGSELVLSWDGDEKLRY